MLELNGKVERKQHMEEDGPLLRYRLHVTKSDRPEASIPCVGCPVSIPRCRRKTVCESLKKVLIGGLFIVGKACMFVDKSR